MTDKQEYSSVDNNTADNIQRNIDRDNITKLPLPFVDAMTTPFQSTSIRAHAATLRLKETKRTRKRNQRTTKTNSRTHIWDGYQRSTSTEFTTCNNNILYTFAPTSSQRNH